VKLTSFGGPLTGSPSWSPDGREIAFDSRPKGHAHIYVMNVSSELPKAITDGDFNDILPTWSHDGRWVYFSSNRSGTWGIWKVPSQGGTPEQVSSAGGFLALESPDEKWIYYTKGDTPGIWRVPAQGGGAESMVVNEPAVGYWGYWTMMGDEIFYLDSSTATPSISAYNLKTRQKSRVHSLRRLPPPFAGITVSPDHKWLLYTDLSESGSHITLVEKFK
jgi:Tol biopolymer transport system component